MKRAPRSWLIPLLLAVLLAGCEPAPDAAAPPPARLGGDAVGHYCGMTLLDHPGPKGQITVAGREQPYWFSSARDTIAFTLLPDEPKDIRAIYVTDMAKAASWEAPGDASWIDARTAYFVLGSDRRGGMGQREAVPFGSRPAAERFAAEHGGQVFALGEIPHEAILGEDGPP